MNKLTKDKRCYVIAGPTASGKTGLAIELAQSLKKDCVVINADSLQIYKGLPILTACPDEEEKRNIPHRLFEQLEPFDKCSVGIWWRLAGEEIKKALDSQCIPIVVGGTGLYIKSLIAGLPTMPDVEPVFREKAQERLTDLGHKEFHREVESFDPILAKRIEVGDSQRLIRAWEVYKATNKPLSDWQAEPAKKPPYDVVFNYIQLMPERKKLYEQCDRRFDKMLETGALKEVERFIAHYGDNNWPVCKALGYQELSAYLAGKTTLNAAKNQAQTMTRRYAKRQITWQKGQMAKKQLGNLCQNWYTLSHPTLQDLVL